MKATYRNWRVYLDDCHIIAERVATYDGRRIAAALNACRDMTTSGLERIAEEKKTLQLALTASALFDKQNRKVG